MHIEQMLNMAEAAIGAEKTNDYMRYHLVIYMRKLVCYPSISVPKDAIRVWSFTRAHKKNGFTPAEWNYLAIELVKADQKGML